MSNWQAVHNARLGETYYHRRHSSGLPLYVWPKAGFRTVYAVFATKYGAIDNAFVEGGNVIELPAGIAHYLEHKLFENEECDAFDRYAETGANANAYTSFDHTAYLFSCTQHAEESLDILLDFVQAPYFTDQTVEKERGIIGQEIRMGEDSPSRRVFCNLMKALYHHHPVSIDIAGTVESIAEITPDLLYRCYERFYHVNNMALVVAGDITCEQVDRLADKWLAATDKAAPVRAAVEEPPTCVQPYKEERMDVAAPLFYLGYKVPMNTGDGLPDEPAKGVAASAVLEEILGGHASPLYARLMEDGLINTAFDLSYWTGPGYACWMMGGESADPQAVCKAFQAEVARLQTEGIDPDVFEECRNAVYGRMISQTDSAENCGDLLIDGWLCGRDAFSILDEVAILDIQSVYDRLQNDFDERACALSCILPNESKEGA